MSRSIGFRRAALHLGGLWALAFAQPLFDLLGRNAQFFVARGSTAGDILLLAFAYALAPPLVGAGLGFLWFNTYPAQVFMGDIGALALGAALGVVAVIVRQEIVLLIMGGVFVVETLSVMLQVAYFKFTRRRFGEGRRLFKMAPLHHHFEMLGWSETQVTMRFWMLAMMAGIGSYLVFLLIFTFVVPGISWTGHLGGLIVGAVLGFLLPPTGVACRSRDSVSPVT